MARSRVAVLFGFFPYKNEVVKENYFLLKNIRALSKFTFINLRDNIVSFKSSSLARESVNFGLYLPSLTLSSPFNSQRCFSVAWSWALSHFFEILFVYPHFVTDVLCFDFSKSGERQSYLFTFFRLSMRRISEFGMPVTLKKIPEPRNCYSYTWNLARSVNFFISYINVLKMQTTKHLH